MRGAKTPGDRCDDLRPTPPRVNTAVMNGIGLRSIKSTATQINAQRRRVWTKQSRSQGVLT